jgi:type II secretory pathway component PulF
MAGILVPEVASLFITMQVGRDSCTRNGFCHFITMWGVLITACALVSFIVLVLVWRLAGNRK